MNVALPRMVTVETFLAWERAQERPSEFDGRRIIPTNGGTRAHTEIGFNLAVLLKAALANTPFLVIHGNIKVVTGAGTVRYPDALVASSRFPRKDDIAPEPVLVVEVLSPSTEREDRYRKNAEYQATPSIQHYLMLEQDAIASELFSRRGEEWIGEVLSGDATIRLPALGIEVKLAGIYAGIEPEADAAAGLG